jgi:hypothetical protein
MCGDSTPFRAARHDEGYSAFHRPRGQRQMRRQGVAQGGDRILSGEIVHAAITFGLPQDRENGRRLEVAAVDKRHQAGNIAGSTGRYPNDVE